MPVIATYLQSFATGATAPGETPGGWFFDVYTPYQVIHYGEEGPDIESLLLGGLDGHLYQYGGNGDAGAAYSFEFTTPSADQGEPRANKRYADALLDCDMKGIDATVTPVLDNEQTALSPTTVNNVVRTPTVIPFSDVASEWPTARNIALNVTCSITDARHPDFYIWEPRWTLEPAQISAYSWQIPPTSFGMDNYKHIGLVRLCHVSTVNMLLVFNVDGTDQSALVVPHGSGIYTQLIFRVPVYKGRIFAIRLTSTAEFRLDPRDSYFEVMPWGSDAAHQPLRIFGDYALIEG